MAGNPNKSACPSPRLLCRCSPAPWRTRSRRRYCEQLYRRSVLRTGVVRFMRWRLIVSGFSKKAGLKTLIFLKFYLILVLKYRFNENWDYIFYINNIFYLSDVFERRELYIFMKFRFSPLKVREIHPTDTFHSRFFENVLYFLIISCNEYNTL